jgi:hypothetical protein
MALDVNVDFGLGPLELREEHGILGLRPDGRLLYSNFSPQVLPDGQVQIHNCYGQTDVSKGLSRLLSSSHEISEHEWELHVERRSNPSPWITLPLLAIAERFASSPLTGANITDISEGSHHPHSLITSWQETLNSWVSRHYRPMQERSRTGKPILEAIWRRQKRSSQKLTRTPEEETALFGTELLKQLNEA